MAAAAALAWPAIARAYRPFDETDADVTPPDELEVELGPVAYLREPPRHLLAPSLVVNYGLAPRWEINVEARGLLYVGSGLVLPRDRLLDTGVNVKTVLRRGALQGASGPSIATEVGLLVPSLRGEPRFGVSGALIASERWRPLAVHVNLLAALDRDGELDTQVGAIVEGPEWRVRPVAEVFVERELPSTRTRSALLGAIWQVDGRLSIDLAGRVARENDTTIEEVRLGATWDVAL